MIKNKHKEKRTKNENEMNDEKVNNVTNDGK